MSASTTLSLGHLFVIENLHVSVIDYGVGNLLSVQRSLEYIGAKVSFVSDGSALRRADRVVLPGVGAFPKAMQELKKRDLIGPIQELAANDVPMLAICLGMQLLLDESDEFGTTAGLGIIPGRVEAIPIINTQGTSHKIPSIGWNEIQQSHSSNDWDDTILRNLAPGTPMYFIHSFMAKPAKSEHCISESLYGGHSISAVIGNKSTYGCQFHPEKSGSAGLTVLKNFLSL
jgi:glutamine amidotransferase